MICPECGSSNLYKRGVRDGRQKYQCRECGRFFIERTRLAGYTISTNKNFIPIEEKRKILLYRINLNLPVADVAKHFKRSEQEIIQLEKKYLDYLKKK